MNRVELIKRLHAEFPRISLGELKQAVYMSLNEADARRYCELWKPAPKSAVRGKFKKLGRALSQMVERGEFS